MDESVRKTVRIISEVAVTIALTALGFVISFWVKLPRRGFICNDPNLSYPYVEETITAGRLVVLCWLVPHIVVIFTELSRHFHQGKDNRRNYTLFNSHIPAVVMNLYIYLGTFWFTLALTHIALNIAKETAGHLRPHFFDACRPVMPGNTTCADKVNQHRFVVDYECTGAGTLSVLTDMGQSFPSSHAALMFFAMVWLTAYVELRWRMRQFRMLKVLGQFFFLMMAWFVAMTRLRDYYHHFVDVVAGSFIGVFMAIAVTRYAFRQHFCGTKNDRLREHQLH